MRFIRLICVFLTACIILSLTACKPDEMKIYYEIASRIQTADPQLAQSDSELLVVKNLYEGLYRLDKNGRPVSGAATCAVSADGLTYSFEINKKAVWSNGEKLTADDFVFAFERALTPETLSPFAQKLFQIENAEDFYRGNCPFSSVGIKSDGERGLTVTLSTANENFPYILASSVCMPCNKEFFEKTKGRYGLSKATVLTNGTFKLSLWNTDGDITLTRFADYSGNFTTSVSRVYLAYFDEDDPVTRLNDDQIDGAMINYSDESRIDLSKYTLQKFPVTAYSMIFNASLDSELRSILIESTDLKSVQAALPDCALPSKSFIPPSYCIDIACDTPFDLSDSRQRFVNYAKKNKIPEISVLCIKDDNFAAVVKSIIEQWQKNLGIYNIKIEYADSETALNRRIQSHNYTVALAPFSDNGGSVFDFLFTFSADSSQNPLNRGYGYFDRKLSESNIGGSIRSLTDESVIIPLFSVNKIYAISSDFKNAVFTYSGGEIDFSAITK